MRRVHLILFYTLSAAIHVALLLCARAWVVFPPPSPPDSERLLLVDFLPEGDSAIAPSLSSPLRDATAAPQPAIPTHRQRSGSLPVKTVPRFVEGVRLATAADVARRAESGRGPSVAPSRVETPPVPVPSRSASADPAPPITTENRPDAASFRNDTPGYEGRMFAQVTVGSLQARDGSYGRIHLFREDASYRDYTPASLFGYSFRQRLGQSATREFETGRVTTPGAYLAVTDLFPDGHLSTMSHTVLLAFPRRPPSGAALYEVVEENDGSFRLRAPGDSYLLFDGRTGALRGSRGFVVEPQGDSGTPPRVAYLGMHVRLEAVGTNPFLRDRPATVVDSAGGRCPLSTSDLFSYVGRKESDVFRFDDDRDFFAYLRDRCTDLVLPEAAPTLVAATRSTEKKPVSNETQGLLPLLLRRLR